VCSWWWGVCACLGVLLRVSGQVDRRGAKKEEKGSEAVWWVGRQLNA